MGEILPISYNEIRLSGIRWHDSAIRFGSCNICLNWHVIRNYLTALKVFGDSPGIWKLQTDIFARDDCIMSFFNATEWAES